MSLTVKELLLNHSRGIPSPVQNTDAQYFDTFIPKFDDITEEIEHREMLKTNLENAQLKIKEEQELAKETAKANAKALKNARREQLKELKKEFKDENPKIETQNGD